MSSPDQVKAAPNSETFFHSSKTEADEILNPSSVPLQIGKWMMPYPAPHSQLHFKPIKWYWVPAFSFDLSFGLSALSFLLYISSVLVIALAPNITGRIVGGLFLSGLASLVVYIIVNISINQSLRTAICRSQFKRDEASRLWEARKPETHSIYEKDIFHEEKTFFYRVVVLRDATVEIRSGSEDRIRDASASKLDIGMQTKIDAGGLGAAKV